MVFSPALFPEFLRGASKFMGIGRTENPDGLSSDEKVKRRQRTHAASGGASEALPHEVGARPSRSEPKLNTHALYPSRSELRGITFKNKGLFAES